MATICTLCGGRKSDIGERGECPHPGAKLSPKQRKSVEHLSIAHNQKWRSERVDDEDGDIAYEAHGPRNSFVRFEGPNSHQDCAIFMMAVTGRKATP